MLKACLNGNRTPEEHSALPITPIGLARDAVAASAAGAEAVHLHVKDAEGVDTLDAVHLGSVLAAVRRAAPGLPLGVTTGAWAEPDPDARVKAIRAWQALPDLPNFASVNWHEPGADEVAATLIQLGIGVEAGLWHVEATEAWLRSPHRDRCCRILLELPDNLEASAAAAEADRLLNAIKPARHRYDKASILLHGEGSSAWATARYACRLGLSMRIGLEDVLHLPDGKPAGGNAALVKAALALLAGCA